MAIQSVINPVDPAWRRTGRTLFQPFDLGKWFALGFSAWLATLGQGGGGLAKFFGEGSDNRGRGSAHDVQVWISNNLMLVIVLACIGAVVGIGLWVVLTWLRSRGQFMFLDNVVHDRALIKEPWKRWAAQGNSLFLFRLVLGLATFGAMIPVGVLIFLGATLMRGHGGAEVGLMVGLIVLAGLVGVALFVGWLIVQVFMSDFVVPIMYLRQVRAVEGWRIFWRELLGPNLGGFAVYLLARLVLMIAVAAAIMMLYVATCCVACCLVAIPYIGAVVLLPVTVFVRCYALYYLGLYGPQWVLLIDPPPMSGPMGGYPGAGPYTPPPMPPGWDAPAAPPGPGAGL